MLSTVHTLIKVNVFVHFLNRRGSPGTHSSAAFAAVAAAAGVCDATVGNVS